MKTSYLIQRLKKPRKGNADNPFTFGGGLLRGGVNERAYIALNHMFTFDYMGSAEFEFGAVPRAIEKIARCFEKNVGVAGEIKICKDVTIYYLCRTDYEPEVIKRIREMASGKQSWRTKERVCLHDAIESRTKPETRFTKYDLEYTGWLELDNAFIFFIDSETFEKFRTFIS